MCDQMCQIGSILDQFCLFITEGIYFLSLKKTDFGYQHQKWACLARHLRDEIWADLSLYLSKNNVFTRFFVCFNAYCMLNWLKIISIPTQIYWFIFLFIVFSISIVIYYVLWYYDIIP